MSESPRELLQRYNLRPKHSWGQNFLGDPGVLRQIAEAVQLSPGDPVLELGPGLGHLTEALLATGAKVTAVERDRDLVKVLEDRKLPGLRVVSGNAAEVNFAEVAQADQVAVCGNLPYHLSSPILFEVLDQVAHVPRAVFTLQKEVVTRLVAEPGGRDYGLLSILLGRHFFIDDVLDLPRHFFHPPPNVDSAVVRLTRLKTPRGTVRDEARFRRVVKAGFGQRRKTLSNALSADRTLATPEEIAHALAAAGVDGKRRAETLTVEEMAAIEYALPLAP